MGRVRRIAARFKERHPAPVPADVFRWRRSPGLSHTRRRTLVGKHQELGHHAKPPALANVVPVVDALAPARHRLSDRGSLRAAHDAAGSPFACAAHESTHPCEDEAFLPVVNSPRMGVCGYAG
jgi:hypothetical protein